jgi:hypothetical protein
MKKYLKILIMLSYLFTISLITSAQDKTSPENKWLQPGYWVVESNIHSPLTNVIYIYDSNDSLIYKEKIEGMKINFHKKAVRRKLDKAVEITMFAFSKSKQKENRYWLVKNILNPVDN